MEPHRSLNLRLTNQYFDGVNLKDEDVKNRRLGLDLFQCKNRRLQRGL